MYYQFSYKLINFSRIHRHGTLELELISDPLKLWESSFHFIFSFYFYYFSSTELQNKHYLQQRFCFVLPPSSSYALLMMSLTMINANNYILLISLKKKPSNTKPLFFFPKLQAFALSYGPPIFGDCIIPLLHLHCYLEGINRQPHPPSAPFS